MKFFTTLSAIAGLAANAEAFALPNVKRESVGITPHADYGSSIGVLGCKIDTNRVAYFPGAPSCENWCIKVTANGRSVNLLRVDASGGAFDMSYDAWNYLKTGQSATENPVAGGPFSASYETVSTSECQNLIHDPSGKLPLSAANSVGFAASCGADKFALYNIGNAACTVGVNDICHMPPPSEGNQPKCDGSQLGVQPKLESQPVWNIMYPSGNKQLAA